jgi:hypothetical protein
MSNPSAAGNWDDAPEERFQRACSGADQPRNLARAFAVGSRFERAHLGDREIVKKIGFHAMYNKAGGAQPQTINSHALHKKNSLQT